jgi:Protein of unknown function (DUF2851)
MANSSKIEEKQLHQIWLKQDFISELTAFTGESITVLNSGDYNKDTGGPDFKHARIKIDNLTFVGDIEIDSSYSDWKNHGHNINKHYNKVILHLCYTNKQKQNYVYTSDGRKVISILLKENISGDNLKFDITLAGKKNVQRNYELKCSDEISLVSSIERSNYILKMGVARFQNKCQKIYHRLKELKFISDLESKEPVIRYELTKEFNEKEFSPEDFNDKLIWNQLLYELIFEALGYSKNKTIMMKLAQNVTLKYLYNIVGSGEELSPKLESVYFHIAGLIPEVGLINKSNVDYISKLSEDWKEISQLYDGKKFDETQWQFLGQRPQNFPTVRISGGAKIVEAIITKNLTSVIIKKFSEIHSTKVLINSIRSLFIVRASGYWKDHFVFEKTSNIKLNYVIGLSRADEIFINVLLPYFSVYFDMFGNEALSRKVLKVYNEYEQRMDNKIVREVANSLQLEGLNKKTIYAQGMIEIYRRYCSKNKCLECEIGKQIFN